MKCSFELNSKGFLKQRESFDIEFKQSFQLGDSLAMYMKSIVGMSNNKGGEIIFGIQDSPRKPVGMLNDKFENCDSNKINQFLTEHFSHEVEWFMETVEIDGLSFGRFWVEESKIKPIVCVKNYKTILREAAIYYRYRGETKEICYPELANILNTEREKEKLLWMKHIQKIGEVGPQNIHLIDTFNGEISTHNGKILLDKDLVSKLKFVKEGQFSEKEGAPTLRLIGQVTNIIDTESISIPKSDVLYPHRFDNLKEKFKLNNFQLQSILWKLDIKGNSKYHTEIATSKKSVTHKYSKALVNKIQSIIERYPDWLTKTINEYKQRNKK